jgi:HlyD family secretion protein
MKKKVIPVVVLLLAAAAVYIGFRRNQRNEDPNRIRVSGNIEITDADVSFKIAGRVTERLVSEGDLVKAGQVVARLDSTDLQQEVSLRKAEIRAAEAALAELLAGSRAEEIEQARAAVRRNEAELERLRLELERVKKLHEQEVLPARDLDTARAAYDVGVERVKESREALQLAEKGPRSEQIDQARANLQRAGEALALAETRAGYAEIVSPLKGVVLSENVEAGEYVSAGTPIVTVGDLANVWLRAFIGESDLGRVKIGQQVSITVDSYPGKTYTGRVTFIASQSEFTPRNVQTQKERVKLVYRIKIDIANPNMELKPGMPADGDIQAPAN